MCYYILINTDSVKAQTLGDGRPAQSHFKLTDIPNIEISL